MDGADRDTMEMIEQWPFQIARAGQQAGHLVCLAMIAHEKRLSIADIADSIAELESSRLLVWSSEHNLYVVSPELAGVDGSAEGLARFHEVLERIYAEPPEHRSARRWTEPMVVDRPAEEDSFFASTWQQE
jgi:hypothetical protein